jgi:hypothetical protein
MVIQGSLRSHVEVDRMDDEIIEGEIIDAEACPTLDGRIADEVEDFQQRMDEMKDMYLFAADHLKYRSYQPQPTTRSAQRPRRGFSAARTCGKTLVKVGNWLLEKCSATKEPLASDEEAGVRWERSHETGLRRPVTLPPPNLTRFGDS